MKRNAAAFLSASPFRCRLVAAILALAAGMPLHAGVPRHPSKIAYPPLNWKAPLGAPYRTTLGNGLKAYIAEDHTLPYFEVVGYVRAAAFLDPPGKEGLGALAARLMRTGGTQRFSADSLDKVLDLYAISFSISLAETEMVCKLSCLSEHADLALRILSEALFYPKFEQAKVDQEKRIAIEMVRHRFDNPEPLLSATYEKALYRGMPNSRLATAESISSITRDDLMQWRQRIIATQNIFLAAAGDFNRRAMADALERLFPAAGGPNAADIANAIAPSSPARCLIVHRPITQAYIRFGLPLFKRPHPDYYALSALNVVLGDDGFTSRLGTKIRSDEGLTYSIYSRVESNYIFPGTFFVSFHTKNESAARATWMALAEIERIRRDGVTAVELAHAKRVLIDGLPSMFRSPGDIVQTYAWNEYYGRADNHYAAYADSINALTAEDLNRVARQYLDTSKLVYAVIGDTAAILGAEPVQGFSFRGLAPMQVSIADSLAWIDQPRIAMPVDSSTIKSPPAKAKKPARNNP